MDVVICEPGDTPLLISMPHCGTWLPAGVSSGMSPVARELPDTDWHIPQLYDFAAGLGAGVIQPLASRYLIDLNRPADNSELYPGSRGTALCPLSTFRDEPVYLEGEAPDAQEIQRRLETYWQPYHLRLQAELARLRKRFGIALLLEAHSIRSRLPVLFDGLLPDLNLGTAEGRSCAPQLRERVEALLSKQSRYSLAVDQRFKGGYITRAYGQPDEGIHSLQLELTQRNYMDEESPFDYLSEQARHLQPLLHSLVQLLIDWANANADEGAGGGSV